MSDRLAATTKLDLLPESSIDAIAAPMADYFYALKIRVQAYWKENPGAGPGWIYERSTPRGIVKYYCHSDFFGSETHWHRLHRDQWAMVEAAIAGARSPAWILTELEKQR